MAEPHSSALLLFLFSTVILCLSSNPYSLFIPPSASLVIEHFEHLPCQLKAVPFSRIFFLLDFYPGALADSFIIILGSGWDRVRAEAVPGNGCGSETGEGSETVCGRFQTAFLLLEWSAWK